MTPIVDKLSAIGYCYIPFFYCNSR